MKCNKIKNNSVYLVINSNIIEYIYINKNVYRFRSLI